MQNPATFQVYNASAGSGKTFTLVKEYLKILLQTSDTKRFQQILAVTFTNKAAAEMKERVIDNLRAFAKADILLHKTEMFQQLEEELSITDTILHQRAEKVLQNILHNYSAFNITTIDSFTHRLIRSFAFDLGLSLNFDVEMDAKSLLNEAVEALIAKIGEDKELTKVLIDFSLQKANEDKSWDITRELNEIAQILLNENDNAHIQKIQERPIQDFIDLKTKLNKKQKSIEQQFSEIGKEGLTIIDSLDIEYKDFYYTQFPKHFQNLCEYPDKLTFDPTKGLAKSIQNNIFYTKNKPDEVKTAIDSIINSLLELYHISERQYEEYTLNKLFLSSLIPLAVLSNINKSLNALKEEKNIRLNAEFNQLISENLQEQPAPFIYERIGEKFKHYFIDEMQDTSILQWQNMIPLIANALSQEGTSLLLVGDTKQSIYRWRGSEPEQFLKLTNKEDSKSTNPFFIPKQLQPLDVNYRSYSEVIDFNNGFFQHLASFFNKQEYADIYVNENQQKQNDKKGGYVQLSFIEEGLKKADEKAIAYAEKVLQIINELSDDFNLNEICVLTRTRKQGVNIADFLTEKGIDIISSETLLLQNSEKVIFMIDLLIYLQNNEDKEAKLNVLYFLHEDLQLADNKHTFFKNLLDLKIEAFFKELKKYKIDFEPNYFIQLSLYESVEYIIRNFHFNKTSDAYIQFFLDEVLQFSLKKSTDITAFLEFWNDKKEALSIVVPEGKNAVRIMTIHKSKGLEFPVVIYPYDLDIYREQNPKVWYPIANPEELNDFDSLLINYNKSLELSGKTGKAIYQSHRNELELDNFNLLYVALTRAVEQLYVIGEPRKMNESLKTSSQFFIHYLQSVGQWNDNQYEYSFGNQKKVFSKSRSDKNSYEISTLISTSWQSHTIAIVANSSLLWDDGDSVVYGNLIHEILAHIKTVDDIESTIETYITTGKITFDQAKEIQKLLIAIVTHTDLKSYYQQNSIVYNEREILTDINEVIIPDRLVINDKNEAVIIDYKTGKPDRKYYHQLNNYARSIEQLGYKVIKKLLVYVGEVIVVEEV
ncbi:MAG: UvrD-helicase domain-containing protein [Flavobacteriaceae bacterium]|nr:UvrD-helicase domain-containing protein [Flavobacteriaceae bacterium]